LCLSEPVVHYLEELNTMQSEASTFLSAKEPRSFPKEAGYIYDHHPLEQAAFPKLCKFTASTWKEIVSYKHLS